MLSIWQRELIEDIKVKIGLIEDLKAKIKLLDEEIERVKAPTKNYNKSYNELRNALHRLNPEERVMALVDLQKKDGIFSNEWGKLFMWSLIDAAELDDDVRK